MSRTPWFARFVLLASVLTLASSPLIAGDATEIAREHVPALVELQMIDSRGKVVSRGTGFFVDPHTIATNYHLIKDASSGHARPVRSSKKYHLTGIVNASKQQDLALLRTSRRHTSWISLKDLPAPRVGEAVYVLGNPRGFAGTLSDGLVSAVRVVGSKSLIQISAPISQGSSGGPVLNESGQLLGIVSYTVRKAQNLNFAIAASFVKRLLKQPSNFISFQDFPRTKHTRIDGLFSLSWGTKPKELTRSRGQPHFPDEMIKRLYTRFLPETIGITRLTYRETIHGASAFKDFFIHEEHGLYKVLLRVHWDSPDECSQLLSFLRDTITRKSSTDPLALQSSNQLPYCKRFATREQRDGMQGNVSLPLLSWRGPKSGVRIVLGLQKRFVSGGAGTQRVVRTIRVSVRSPEHHHITQSVHQRLRNLRTRQFTGGITGNVRSLVPSHSPRFVDTADLRPRGRP